MGGLLGYFAIHFFTCAQGSGSLALTHNNLALPPQLPSPAAVLRQLPAQNWLE